MYEGIFYKVNDLGQFEKVLKKSLVRPMDKMYLPMEDTTTAKIGEHKVDYSITVSAEFVKVRVIGEKVYYVLKS